MTLRRGASSFVGRGEQLDRLEQALRSAQQGTPTTVLIGGDAGIGKTRLITEFTARVRDQDALVLEGGCLELGEEGLPYAAVSEALRGLDAALPTAELRRLAGEDLPALARVVPGLRGEVSGVSSGGDGHGPPRCSEHARTRPRPSALPAGSTSSNNARYRYRSTLTTCGGARQVR